MRQPGGISSVAQREVDHDHHFFVAQVTGAGEPSMAPALGSIAGGPGLACDLHARHAGIVRHAVGD